MAKKKKKTFHSSDKKNSIFPTDNKITPVESIHSEGTGPYGDTMEYADKVIKGNSKYIKKTD